MSLNISLPITKDSQLINSLVNSYREIIQDRYQYEFLKRNFKIPEGVTKEVVDSIRGYYLRYIYPDTNSRVELSTAFDSLKTYASNPDKVFKIARNLSGAIFKFGFHLPQAIRVALHSWDAYRKAKIIEIELLKSAKKLQLTSPISKDQVLQCLTEIPKSILLKFSKEVLSLFKSFANQTLLKKTIEILDEISIFMKERPETYPDSDLNAITISRSIIHEGFSLLSQYDSDLREEIIKTIYDIEMGCLDMIYETNLQLP